MLTSEVCMCGPLPRLRAGPGDALLSVSGSQAWAGPGLREALLGPQVPEQVLNQAHPREAVCQDPLHPLKRYGC